VLVNFSSWTPYVDTTINLLLHHHWRIEGNIGSRDTFYFAGKHFNIHEAQSVKGDFGSWRVYLYEFSTGSIVQLTIQTHNRSRAFGNPTYTNVTSPNGRSAFVATVFLFAENAAPDEAGELIFYKEYADRSRLDSACSMSVLRDVGHEE